MDKVSYALGLGIGRQLCDMGARELNIDDFAQAIKDVIAGAKKHVSDAEAQTLVQNFFAEQEKKQPVHRYIDEVWGNMKPNVKSASG